jgi:SAM-dependent methyltransferase
MNIVNMLERKDPNIFVSSSVKSSKRKIDGILYRGFDIFPSETPQIRIHNVLQWYPFSERKNITGWQVLSFDKNTEGKFIELQLQDEFGSIIVTEKVYLRSSPTPVPFPSFLAEDYINHQYDLVLHLPQSTSDGVFFIVYQVLERSTLLSLCVGRGVEIGPGNNPQVLPSDQVDITYIEQSSPEQWNSLYNDTGKYNVNPTLWSRYQIGEAHSLPVANESLDFIFSSHVFEHLANPLGHLQYWFSKLKRGGLILAIVPDLAGCKDYVYRPCSLSEILQEYHQEIMEPNLEHYKRWAKYRAPGQDPQKFYEAKRSIHIHFYTNWNMKELLSYAVEHLGYSSFNIYHTPNHKDFYFALAKA